MKTLMKIAGILMGIFATLLVADAGWRFSQSQIRTYATLPRNPMN